MKKYQSKAEPGRYLHVLNDAQLDSDGKVPCLVIRQSGSQIWSSVVLDSLPGGWEPIVTTVNL